MGGEGHSPEGRAQGRVEGREPGVPSAAACRRAPPALPPLRAALTAALRQRVAQRAGWDHPALPPLVGHICERCWDAPAVLLQPAPDGEEMGVCEACQQEPHAGDEAPQAE